MAEKLFRKFKKVTNLMKNAPKRLNPISKHFEFENNVTIDVEFTPVSNPDYLVKPNVMFTVKKDGKKKFLYVYSEQEHLLKVNRETEEFFDLKDVQGFLNAIKENIIPLIVNPSNEGYQNLGIANGWKETPEIIQKINKIRDSKPLYFLEYVETENIGRCWNRFINHTFKYIYEVDSSD